MSITQAIIILTRQLIRHYTCHQHLVIVLKDGRRKESISFLRETRQFQCLWRRRVSRECAVRIDRTSPVDSAHTRAHSQWSDHKQPLVAYLGYAWHFPKRTTLGDIAATEEYASVIAPLTRSLVIAMQSGNALSIF